jgi:nucleoside-diphosphate-sugar epimerase
MDTILLTGATGFLGSHLLEALVVKGYQVVILKRSTSNTWRIVDFLDQVVSYDIDQQSLEQVFRDQRIDTVIHLATLYRKYDNFKDVTDMVHTNVNFPVNLLEIGLSNGIKRFINTGTFFEYDCTRLPVNEGAKIKPFNLYAKTKLAFESILQTYSDQIAINTFRLFSPYGEKDNNKLIPFIIQKALAHEKIELSDGLQKLDFLYVADIVDAYMRAIEEMQVQNRTEGYEVFNLGSGMALSIRDIVSIIEQQLGETLPKVWGAPSSKDMQLVVADIAKVSSSLGWEPAHTIHQGIANTISYYQSKR